MDGGDWWATVHGVAELDTAERSPAQRAPVSHWNPKWGGEGLSAGIRVKTADSGPRLLGSSPGSASTVWTGANALSVKLGFTC